MAVRIEEINVANLGPITEFGCQLGSLNLIYGRNEVGKTYLVEFLLSSLFSDLTDWNLRSNYGRGRVIVSGLDGEPIHFTPASREKLESYLENSWPGLPPKISRLLVVKGAELGMDGRVHGGVNKLILKEYLSGQSTLDAIRDNIPKTTQKARIINGKILGDKRGEIARLGECSKEKELVDSLFTQLDESYSEARRQALRGKRESLVKEQEGLVRAKSHLAYELDQKRQLLEADASKYPSAILEEIDGDLRKYLLIRNSVAVKQKELTGLEKDSINYQWLTNATSEYEKRIEVKSINVNPIFLIMTIIFLVIALIASFLSVSIVPGVFVLLAFLTGGLYLRQLQKKATYAPSVDEVQKTERVFQQRFGEPLTDLATMETKKKQLEERHYRAQTLSDQLRNERTEMETLELSIVGSLEQLSGEKVSPSDAQSYLTRMTEQLHGLLEEINEIDKRLLRLNVEPEEYEMEPGEVDFDQKRLDDIEFELMEIEMAIKSETDALDNIKQRICDQTGDKISTEWDRLIENLRTRRNSLLVEEKQLKSRLAAQICLTEVLDELGKQEDELIRTRLESPLIQAPLKAVTGRYNNLYLDGEQLIVRDDLGEFEVKDLSTGAREQVLLALRLGIASHVLRQDRMFLILDDAFQHSDWRRREFLIDQVVKLAQQDWQVIYFTMDDHIMNLFKNRGDSLLGDDFVFEVLVKETAE